MTRISPKRPALVAAACLAASIAAPAHADDPPAAEGRDAEVGAPAAPDLPRADATLDAKLDPFPGAMPIVIYPADPRTAQFASDARAPVATEATGAVDVETPPLGERPTPREALRRDELGETIMRPRGGSATGGKPDVPPER